MSASLPPQPVGTRGSGGHLDALIIVRESPQRDAVLVEGVGEAVVPDIVHLIAKVGAGD